MRNPHAVTNAAYAGIAALMMLFFGWFYGLSGISSNAFYNLTVDVFTWTLRIGGLAMLAVAIVCYTGQTVGLLLDAIVSGLCGAIIFGCGAYWLIDGLQGGGISINYLLYVIFGGMFLNSARANWQHWAASARPSDGFNASPPAVPLDQSTRTALPRRLRARGDSPKPEPPNQPEPVHPASVRPESLTDETGPPPGGYLAALAREKEKPPQADYE
jgi:hypothetical protein